MSGIARIAASARRPSRAGRGTPGDGLLAVFGAPRRQTDHADRAPAAALQIAATVRSEHGLQIGTELNSGRVVAGNVGGAAGWSSA